MADNIISIAKTFSTTEREFHVARNTGLLIIKKFEEWLNEKQNYNYEEDECPRVNAISYEEYCKMEQELDKLEDKLDAVEDKLETIFGIND